MGLTELSTPPPHISREDHAALTSSTPQSFDDIPPVLRFQDNVEIILTPGSVVNLEGRIRGSLWVTEANLAFLPDDEAKRPGFKLDYQSLTLHALTPATSDLEAHLYCQIDDGQADQGDEDDYGEMRELRVFVGEGQLSPLFEALSDCSALHASLMPSGEPSSFPFFPPNEDGSFDDGDDDEWEEDDGGDGDMQNGNGNSVDEGGRVHLTRGSGHVLMSFSDRDHDHDSGKLKLELDEQREKGKKTKNQSNDKDGGEVDQMERFLNMVEWGNVPKPTGWEEGDEEREKERVEDAPLEHGEVEDVMELAKRLGAVDVAEADQQQ